MSKVKKLISETLNSISKFKKPVAQHSFLIPAVFASCAGLVILYQLQKYCGKSRWMRSISLLLIKFYILLDPYCSITIAYAWASMNISRNPKIPKFEQVLKGAYKHLFNSTFWTLDINEDFFDGFLIKIAFVVFAIGLSKY